MIISLKGIANSTGVILKGIINSTDVIFFVLAILPLLINIVLNIRNCFVIKLSRNTVDNSNCTFDFTFWSNVPPAFFAYLVISNYTFRLIIVILCVVNIWTDLIKTIMCKPIDKFSVIMDIMSSALHIFAIIFIL